MDGYKYWTVYENQVDGNPDDYFLQMGTEGDDLPASFVLECIRDYVESYIADECDRGILLADIDVAMDRLVRKEVEG